MSLRSPRFKKSKLLAQAGVLAVLAAGMAGPAHVRDVRAEDAAVEFRMPAQSLDLALRSFGVAADKQVMFSADLVDGKRAQAVMGTLTPIEALERILAGSGLVYETTSSNVILIKSPDQAAAKPTPASRVQMAQVAETARRNDASAADDPREAAGGGRVTGTVTDQRTGANLKGALVEIVETGQTVATDDLGRFRFASVRAGRYTLRISYLGFADQVTSITVAGGRDLQQDFALQGGSEMVEIIVYGSRSARAQSLNQERMAENVSTVVSADLLGNFSGQTISEALRRASGVAFTQSSQTGDGTNIIVRGLEADLNTVKLNGVELPVGDGRGRSADLGNILADSVDRITISKTLLPSQDSSGTGGLIEIETKSPLDRPRRYASFVVEGAKRGNDFSDDLLVSGTLSGSFGSDDALGLSASVQYRNRDSFSLSYSPFMVFGQYFPLEADGSTSIRSTRDIDPRTPFPFEPSAADAFVTGFSQTPVDVDTATLAFTVSSEWQPAVHTNLRVDYQRSVSDTDTASGSASFFGASRYEELPVASLDGEARRVLNWTGRIRPSQFNVVRSNRDVTHVLSFRGDSSFGQWDVGYAAGYTRGSSTRQEIQTSVNSSLTSLDPAFVLPEATDPVEGRVLTLFGPRQGSGAQLPLLTQAGFDAVNDPANYLFSRASQRGNLGRNRRYTADFSVRRSFDGAYLQYIEAGVAYESSRFKDFQTDTDIASGSLDLASLGLPLDTSGFSRIGVDGGIAVLSLQETARFLRGLFVPGQPDDRLVYNTIELNPLLRDTSTQEDELAGYVQSRIDVGDVEFVGGVRISRVAVDARVFNAPAVADENGVPDIDFQNAFAEVISQKADGVDVLPRILVNYRPQDNLVVRGGYFLSVARPQISLLSNSQSISLDLRPVRGPNNDQPRLRVSRGNPALSPSSTHNFDLSAEYYSEQIGAIKLGVFYKRISDFIQTSASRTTDSLDGVELPDDPRFTNLPDNIFIEVTRPENAEDVAEIWGIEASVERQLTFLPGFWSGLGVFANYTYSDSSKTLALSWNEPVFDAAGNLVDRERATVDFSGRRFDQQPNHSGTAALTYNKYGLDVTLAYSYQARLQTAFIANGLSRFREPVETLDLRVEYRFDLGPGNFRVYFEGSDLLKGTDDARVADSRGGVGGTPKFIERGVFLGGREFRLGLAATF